MRTQIINFPNQQALCAFPDEHSDLGRAISELQLDENYPVIVLIGGDIDKEQAVVTEQAIQTISRVAEDTSAAVICGGTDMGVMAAIGQARQQNNYKFPLVGIAPADLVTWPDGPRTVKFLWVGKQRWQLEPHHTHFILVPGSKFGDESAWIVDAASILSKGHHAVTVLVNGGEVSRKDIDLSLEHGRSVIVLSRTGRLADEIARQPSRHKLITVVPANVEKRIVEVVQAALSVNERVVLSKLLLTTLF